jgi:hypothetical protein
MAGGWPCRPADWPCSARYRSAKFMCSPTPIIRARRLGMWKTSASLAANGQSAPADARPLAYNRWRDAVQGRRAALHAAARCVEKAATRARVKGIDMRHLKHRPSSSGATHVAASHRRPTASVSLRSAGHRPLRAIHARSSPVPHAPTLVRDAPDGQRDARDAQRDADTTKDDTGGTTHVTCGRLAIENFPQ